MLKRILVGIFGLLALGLAAAPKPQIDVLFLGHQRPVWQDMYWQAFVKDCKAEGINACIYTEDGTGHSFAKYTPEVLKKFHVVVLQHEPFEDPRSTDTPEQKKQFLKNLDDFYRAGGSILWNIYTANRGPGQWTRAVGKNYDVAALDEDFYDPSREVFVSPNARARFGLFGYIWTTNVKPHPVTAGVKGLFLPRWACYKWPGTAPMAYGKTWTTVLSGMPETISIGNINTYETGKDVPNFKPSVKGTYDSAPPVIGVREPIDGSGRMMVLPIDATHTWLNHRSPVTAEAFTFKGDGIHQSQGFKLIANGLRYLGEAAVSKGGFGGYREPAFPEAELPKLDWTKLDFPNDNWSGLTEWFNVRTQKFNPVKEQGNKEFRGVFGPRTANGGGTGTVAEYVAEAKKLGLSFIIFGDDPRKHTEETFARYVADCKAASDENFAAIPGFVYRTTGDYLMFSTGVTRLPVNDNFDAEGRILRPVEIADMNNWGRIGQGISMLKAMPVKPYWHHIIWNAAPFVYEGGKLVDDGFDRFLELEGMGHNLFPYAMLRIDKPADLAPSLKTAMVNVYCGYNPSGVVSPIGNEEFPHRAYMTNGPSIKRWGVINPFGQPYRVGGNQFRLKLEAESAKGIASIKIYNANDGTLYRNFDAKGAKTFTVVIDESHKKQFYLVPVVEDVDGRRAVGSTMRTYQDGQRLSTMGDRFMDTSAVMRPDASGKRLEQFGAWVDGFHKDIPIAGGSPSNPWWWSLKIRGIDGGSVHAARVLISPVVHTAAGSEPQEPAYRYNPRLAATDYAVIDLPLDGVQFKANSRQFEKFPEPPRHMIPLEIADITVRNWAVGARNLALVSANVHEVKVTIKKATTLDRIELALLSKNQPQAPGEYDLLFLKDREGEFAWQFDVGESLNRKGTLGRGDYIYPSNSLGGAPGLVNLDEQPMSYEIGSRNCRVFLDGGKREVRPGDVFTARFLIFTHPYQGQKNNVWLRDFIDGFGINHAPAYSFLVKPGTVREINYALDVRPDQGGAIVRMGKADLPHDVPVRIFEMPENALAGRYDLETQELTILPVLDGITATSVDTTRGASAFYLGEVIRCPNRALVFSLAPIGDKLRLEIHNPTDRLIATSLSGSPHLPPFAALKAEVKVPARSSIKLDLSVGPLKLTR